MLYVALASFLFAGVAPVPGDDAQVVELSWKTSRNWDIQLPAEQFRKVSGGFAIPHAGGELIPAVLDGTALLVDSDGDGTPELRVEGKEDDMGVRHAVVTVHAQREDGSDLTFTARLQDAGKGWEYAAAGFMEGKVGNTRVRLIDQDLNGRYDDVGVDAMVLGRGDMACLLSEAVHVDGQLYRMGVAADGRALTLATFDGPTGQLDLKSQLKTQGKLQSLVVTSQDGRYSFDLAGTTGAVKVPAGRYELTAGQFGFLDNVAKVRQGRMAPIEVPADGAETVRWGGPLHAEFRYQRVGSEVMFDPNQVTYFGAAGEEYKVWDPAGKSPEFLIRDLRSGAEIAKAMFPGSC